MNLRAKEDVTDNVSLTPVTPLPRKELFHIWIIHASQGFQTTMLFPMLVFMVEKYGVTGKSGNAVGYYAGILASLFPLAQCCSSILWGVISDKYGRRLWLAFGNIVSAASSLFLGLSQTYPSACAVRFVGGLLNGTMTITKSTLAELCDGTNQDKGFGILNLGWGIGAIAGPVFSGILAEPCQQYKFSKCPAILQTHPFLLPCLSATFFSSIATCSALSLKETNAHINAKKMPYKLATSYAALHESSAQKNSTSREMQYFGSDHGDDQVEEFNSESVLSIDETCKQRLLAMVSTRENITKDDLARRAPCLRLSNSITAESTALPRTITPSSTMSTLRDRDVLFSSLCYSMTGLIFIITDELFPMFGASPVSVGGLGFSSADLGIVLGEGGVVLFLYTLVLYPRVATRFGPLYCFRYGILGSIPLWILFPACSMLSKNRTYVWILLLFTMAARSIVACTTFTGVLILVSNSATPANMGTVTGLSHSLCSFFRAIGPALGGAIWSYASRKSFPLHQFLAWTFVVLLSFLTFGLSYLLAPTLVRPKDTR